MLSENKNNSPYHNLPQPDYGEFVGREEELTKILNLLRPYPISRHHLIVIDGIGGIGKSTLALEIAHRCLQRSVKETSGTDQDDGGYLTILRKTLIDLFSEDELRTLCFDMALDYEMLPGQGKGGKVRELLLYLKRRNRLDELIENIQEARPEVSLKVFAGESIQKSTSGESFEAIIWTSAKSDVLTGEGIIPRRQIMKTLDDIYTTIAITLQREDITRALPEEKDEIVRRALTQQRTLLIVDNLETVDDDNVIAFLRELPAPTKAVVTTRHRIDVAYAFRLMGMPWEDAQLLIANEVKEKSISINEQQTHQLYERTGGVPLALVWSIGLIEWGYRVESVLAGLGSPTSDIARFTFDNSVKTILERPAYKLLVALSLFPEGATRIRLGEITKLPELDRDEGIIELQRLSLISHQGGQYDALPLTKNYLHSSSAQRATLMNLKKAFVDYFDDFIKRHVPLDDYWKSKKRWSDFTPVLAELNNLIAAVPIAEEIEEWQIVRDIAVGVVHGLWRSGLWEQRVQVLEIGIKAAKHLNYLEDEAWFRVNGLGLLFVRRGEIEKALLEINTGRSIGNKIGNTDVLVFAEIALASILLDQGDIAATEEKLLTLLPQKMSPVIRAQLFSELSHLYERRGNYEAMKSYALQGIDVCFEIDDYSEAALGYVRLAQAHLNLGEFEQSQKMLENAVEANETAPSSVVRAEIFYNLGQVECEQGHIEIARTYFENAREQFSKLGIPSKLNDVEKALEELAGK